MPFSPRSTGTTPIDPIAAAWGGLAGAIGLMAGAGRDWPARLAIAAAAFLLAGFLAGVRAAGRRTAHAVAAWLAGYAIHAAFVVLATAIDAAGGPDAPALAPGGGRSWLLAAAWALGFALVGAVIVNHWLTPRGGRAPMRRRASR